MGDDACGWSARQRVASVTRQRDANPQEPRAAILTQSMNAYDVTNSSIDGAIEFRALHAT